MKISLNRWKITYLFIFCLLPALVACNLSGAGKPTVDNNANATATAIFQTLDAQSAEMTVQASGQPPAPAATELPPAETQPVALTEPPALQPGQPTIQAGGAITITATVNTSCRMGPSVQYPKVSNLGVNLRSTIVGKNNSGDWFLIRNIKKGGGLCWVENGTFTIDGDTASLPVITAIPFEAAQTQGYQTAMAPKTTAVNKTPKRTPTPSP
jgi:hypothetical protein